MKAWLINPPKKGYIREGRCQQPANTVSANLPPLTLAKLSAVLGKKYETKIIDCAVDPIDQKSLIQNYIKEKPEVTFIATSTPTIDSDLKFIKVLKNLKVGKIYVFGIHVSYFKKKIKGLDIICGPPENIFPNHKNITPDWKKVNTKKYIMPIKNRPFLVVQTSTGCPYSCSFCTAPYYYGKKILYKPISQIIKEIRLIKDLGIQDIFFFSENFTSDKRYVQRLCSSIIKNSLNINWICNTRADTIDRKTASLMKKAGCWLISIGIESYDQDALDKCKKRLNVFDIEKAINIIKNSGMWTLGHIILGLDISEKMVKKTVKKTIDSRLDFAMFNILTPFPGSPLYEREKTDNFGDIGYDKSASDKWLIKIQKKAYLKFYTKPSRIMSLIKKMSWQERINYLILSLKFLFSTR